MRVDRILLTRPAPQSARFAAACQARFGLVLRVIESPILEIRKLDEQPDLADAQEFVVSSENAARILVDSKIDPRPVSCVGARSSRLLRDEGWPISEVEMDAARLLATLATRKPSGPIVHLTGAHVAVDIAAELAAQGVPARREILYEQVERPLNGHARDALATPEPILVAVFSPRSARLLSTELRAAKAELFIAAMSHAVADALSVQGAAKIEVAASPDSLGMLDALSRLRGG